MMKYFILSLFVISIMACNQEGETSPLVSVDTGEESTNTKITRGNTQKAGTLYLIYINDDTSIPAYVRCLSSGNTCMRTVVIYGAADPGISDSDRMQNIISAIKDSNPAQIVSLFQVNEVFLKQYIDNELVDGAINGDYTVLSPDAEDPEESFITFGTSNSLDDVYMAYPFKFE